MNFCPECGSKFLGGRFCSGCAFDLSRYVLIPEGATGSVTNIGASINELDTAFSMALRQKTEEQEKERLAKEKQEKERLEREREEKERQEKLKQERFNNRFQIVGVILSRYTGEEEVVTIPEGVKYIGNCCFQSNAFIKKVIFPKSLIKIDFRAFYNCKNLEEVEFTGTDCSEIGKETFSNCSKIQTVTIPSGVTEIAEKSFEKCTSLETVVFHRGITRIGPSAFLGCTCLKNIDLPVGLKFIDGYAFKDCKSLNNVQLPIGLTQVGYGIFQNCVSIEKFTFPSDMKNVPYFIFDGCVCLSEVYLSNCTSIGESSFQGCINLTNINLTPNMSHIGRNAFMNCSYLKSITIPSSVKEIKDGAFFNTDIRSVTLPQNCTYNNFKSEDKLWCIVYEPSFPYGCKIEKK